MNIIQLEYFMMLAKLGSFRKTAEKFYVTQPAVSKQISALEKEWGFPLFDRSYRVVTLTPAGRTMMNMLEQADKDFKDAVNQAKLSSKVCKMELRLGVPECTVLGNFSDILAEFQQENPDVALSVRHVPVALLELNYPEPGFDMIISYDHSLHGNSDYETVVLGRRKHIALISKNHPLYRDGAVRFEDLKGERIYVPAPEGSTATVDYCAYICACHGFSPHEHIVLPNVESALLAVKMCMGIVVLDDLIDLPPHFDLAKIPIDVEFDFVLGWHKENQNPMIPVLAEKLRTQLQLESVDN